MNSASIPDGTCERRSSRREPVVVRLPCKCEAPSGDSATPSLSMAPARQSDRRHEGQLWPRTAEIERPGSWTYFLSRWFNMLW